MRRLGFWSGCPLSRFANGVGHFFCLAPDSAEPNREGYASASASLIWRKLSRNIIFPFIELAPPGENCKMILESRAKANLWPLKFSGRRRAKLNKGVFLE